METKTVKKIIEDLLISLKLPDKELSILFVNNKKIAQLNKRFFQKDRPTNVISFSYMDGLFSEAMGDIVVSLEKTSEEARQLSIPFYERLFALIVHGILHILGFDHVDSRNEARRMRYREKKLLNLVFSHPLYRQLLAR